jgi:hypothetical protein
LQECQKTIVCAEATERDVFRSDPVQGAFLHGQVSLDIDVRRFDALVAQVRTLRAIRGPQSREELRQWSRMGPSGSNDASRQPTLRQRRILVCMSYGDRIWEVVGKSYRTIYNEKLGRDQRVPDALVEEMERQGWIRRLDNPSSQRLDGWELTEQGTVLAAQFRVRRRTKGAAVPDDLVKDQIRQI